MTATITATEIKLTEPQKQAMLHRLGVPDAMADGFTDTWEDEACTIPTYPYTREEVEEEGYRLYEIIEKTSAIPLDGMTQLRKDMLKDCITGSTWVACASNESKTAASGAYNVLYNIAGKLNQHLDLGIQPDDIPDF